MRINIKQNLSFSSFHNFLHLHSCAFPFCVCCSCLVEQFMSTVVPCPLSSTLLSPHPSSGYAGICYAPAGVVPLSFTSQFAMFIDSFPSRPILRMHPLGRRSRWTLIHYARKPVSFAFCASAFASELCLVSALVALPLALCPYSLCPHPCVRTFSLFGVLVGLCSFVALPFSLPILLRTYHRSRWRMGCLHLLGSDLCSVTSTSYWPFLRLLS